MTVRSAGIDRADGEAFPGGTLTMLFTDIEGSTQVLNEIGDQRYADLLADHHRFVVGAGRAHDGRLVDTQGDAVFMVFTRPADAVRAAIEAQRAVQTHAWPRPLRVRMGLHIGTIERREMGYVGAPVHVAARVASAANGEQILLTSMVADLIGERLPATTVLVDLGTFRLRDVGRPLRLFRVRHEGLIDNDRLPRARSARPNRGDLPTATTALVGRVSEIETVEALVLDHRLVTLTGSGGIGKTRLAIEVARRLASILDDNVRFVPLSSIPHPSQVLTAVAESVDARTEGSQAILDSLIEMFGEHHHLLVLDNFEHVLEAAPDIAALIRGCPRLHVLVTSRQRLHLGEEREFAIGPLELPNTSGPLDPGELETHPAVQLFVDRARRRRRDFRLTADTAPLVLRLCRRLDGLPLAIELVASRAGFLSPGQMLERLGSRLDLTADAIDAPQRQQTLRATIDWSFHLLSVEEQRLATRLCVFSGGADFDAVEFVCGDDSVPDVLGTLASLVDKNLVSVHGDARGDPRFSMLETVREYMSERLVEHQGSDGIRDRHVAWFRQLSESCDYVWHDDAHERWPALEANVANVRAAWRWSREREDVATLAVFAASLWSWSWLTGRIAEARGWVEDVMELVGQGRPDTATMARLSFAVGASRFNTGAYDEAEPALRSAWQAAEKVDEANLSWAAEGLLGLTMPHRGRLDEAVTLLEHVHALCEANGKKWSAGYAASVLGALRLLVDGDAPAALALHQRSLALGEEIGAIPLVAQAHTQLAYLDILAGTTPAAWEHLRESTRIYELNPNREGVAYALDTAAILSFSSGDMERAAELHAAAERVRTTLGMPVWPILRPMLDGLRAQVEVALADEAYARARDRGAAQDPARLLASVVFSDDLDVD